MTCVVYQGDVNLYMYEQETLKQITEEAACQGALALSEEEYACGRLVFDKEAADEAVERYIRSGMKLFAGGNDYNTSFITEYEDDETGYGADNPMHYPTVTVTMTIETDDFFRLPLMERKTITRQSKYEIRESLTDSPFS